MQRRHMRDCCVLPYEVGNHVPGNEGHVHDRESTPTVSDGSVPGGGAVLLAFLVAAVCGPVAPWSGCVDRFREVGASGLPVRLGRARPVELLHALATAAACLWLVRSLPAVGLVSAAAACLACRHFRRARPVALFHAFATAAACVWLFRSLPPKG